MISWRSAPLYLPLSLQMKFRTCSQRDRTSCILPLRRNLKAAMNNLSIWEESALHTWRIFLSRHEVQGQVKIQYTDPFFLFVFWEIFHETVFFRQMFHDSHCLSLRSLTKMTSERLIHLKVQNKMYGSPLVFHMASMLDNYLVITIDVCTLGHLPRQLSFVVCWISQCVVASTFGSPLTAQGATSSLTKT